MSSAGERLRQYVADWYECEQIWRASVPACSVCITVALTGQPVERVESLSRRGHAPGCRGGSTGG